MSNWSQDACFRQEALSLRQMVKDYPDMPQSARDKINLWIKMYEGDSEALNTLLLQTDIISKKDFDDLQQENDNPE